MKISGDRIQGSATNENRLSQNCCESKTTSSRYKRLLTTSEEHYLGARSGSIYSSGPATYSFWSRYLDAFDEVVVLARVKHSDCLEDERESANGPHISFRSLPDHAGPWQYLRVRREAQRIARHAITDCDAYLLRVPGLVSQMVWGEIRRLKKRYAVEVLGDPWQALSPGTWSHILRPAFRLLATQQLKRICAGAMAVNYVTSKALQKRYPSSKSAHSVAFSDVRLEQGGAPANIVEERYRRLRELPWSNTTNGIPIHIGFIGSFSRLYKGPDILLRAAALCRNQLNFQLIMIGEGHYLPEMKNLAHTLRIQDRVQFLGELSFASVFKFLDSIDLFVMPSRAEGLPRALVEAMSRGCSCIASAVGGIPELLDAADLVPAGSPAHLANLILQVAADSDRLLAMSTRNLAKAAQFDPHVLTRSRQRFLEVVRRNSSSD